MYTGLLQKSLEKTKAVNNSESLRQSAISRYAQLCNMISSENFEGSNFPNQSSTGTLFYFFDVFVTLLYNSVFTDLLSAMKKKLRTKYAESFQNQFLQDMIKRGMILKECSTPCSSAENYVPSRVEYCSSGYGNDTTLMSLTAENPKCKVRLENNKNENNFHASQNPFLPAKMNFNLVNKRNTIPANNTDKPNNLLFGLSLLNEANTYSEVKANVGLEQIKRTNNMEFKDDDDVCEVRDSNRISLEVNYPSSSSCKETTDISYLENVIPTRPNRVEKANVREKSALFAPSGTEVSKDLITQRLLLRNKNKSTQTMRLLNCETRRHSKKQNLKVSQQGTVKNLKHVPAILRRYNNVVSNKDRMNLFDESMHINKEPRENFVFTPPSLLTKLDENSNRLEALRAVNSILNNTDEKDVFVNTCVMASPRQRNDEIRKTRNLCLQIDSKQQPQNNIFLNNIKKNIDPPIQKTIMFTKKDPRNIDHCLRLNSSFADNTVDDSNICTTRKNIPRQLDTFVKSTCVAHKNCQKISTNCHPSIHCSQNSSNTNNINQEFKESSSPQMQIVQGQQEFVVCDKMLPRKEQRHIKCENDQQCCNKDQHVCFVVVDQCKDLNSAQNCSTYNVPLQTQKSKTLQNGYFCQEDVADVGILTGVQNLQILPMEERESRIIFTNNRYIDNTVLLEEQPVKYMAFDNDSKAQKVPIYMQTNNHVASIDNVGLENSKVNYHVVSCPQETSQNVIFIPTCEQDKVVYAKDQTTNHSNASFERCSHPRKVVFYQPECQSKLQYVKDSSNLYEVHVPTQNVMGIRNTLTTLNNVKKSRRSVVNGEYLHYQPTHGKKYKFYFTISTYIFNAEYGKK